MIINDDKTPFSGTIVINGDNVAGRLLEDVMFLADVSDGIADLTSVRVDQDGAAYLDGYLNSLNKEKWLQEIRDHIADENEHFETTDGDDVWVDSGAEIEIISIDELGSIDDSLYFGRVIGGGDNE